MSDQTVTGMLQTYTNTALKINSNAQNILNVNKLSSLVSTTNALNDVISNMYGVTAKWFRAVPNDRSKDVIFHEYTLYNVEDCGFDINIMYTDSGYDEAALNFQMMGIQYQIPLTCEISIDNWNAATNNDGTLPQKGDIVYIPQSNKLYQVVSMNPVKTVASQITSYKCNLSIYKATRSRVLNNDLAETIDNYTESIDSIFGNDIKQTIENVTADKQTSPFNSTIKKDKYKEFSYNDMTDYIISNTITSDGHILSNNYYHNNIDNFLVKYHVNDNITKDDTRFLSVFFRIKNDKMSNNIELTNEKKYDRITLYDINNVNIGDSVVFNKGMINVFGIINDKNKFEIDNNILKRYPNTWYKIQKYNVYKDKTNILSGYQNNNKILSIDILHNIIILNINNKVTQIPINCEIKENEWYNLSLNFGNICSGRIFSISDKINMISEFNYKLNKFDNLEIDEYTINAYNTDISNLRLFNTDITDIDKQLINITSKFSNSESNTIIIDNVDEFNNREWYGTQR